MVWRAIATSAVLVSRYAAVAGLAIVGCRPSAGARAVEPTAPPIAADARVARVSLGTVSSAVLTATSGWRLTDIGGRVLASGDSGQRITVTSGGRALRVDNRGRQETISTDVAMFGSTRSIVSLGTRRYRGDFAIVVADSGVQIINRVLVEQYLRGVVPRELGTRLPGDRAALEAQAVAARSYAVTRLGNASRAFDLVATTSDQVYGGVDAENAVADAAVASTEGLVLKFGDRIVSAPYFSTCGGSTAEPSELWRSRNEPFLQRVSDQIPGSDRYYCDVAPRFRWERSWRGDTLMAVLDRYLRAYAQVPAGSVGTVRDIAVEGRTPSGRVERVAIETERGRYSVRGNDIRYVLRSPGGELLNSTYFSPEFVASRDGRLARLTIRGLGYGHGVGMCQWGAIGRARAGQDFRTILSTYFPGTSVARAY